MDNGKNLGICIQTFNTIQTDNPWKQLRIYQLKKNGLFRFDREFYDLTDILTKFQVKNDQILQ